MSFKLPDTPYIVAGGFGGPFCVFTCTPARNALTIAASAQTASISQVYKQVFSTGFARGWAGGVYPAASACPAFIFVGPAYHMFQGVVGTWGACFLAGVGESAIFYGGETANCQTAINEKKPGTFKTVHSPFKPWGPGIGIHVMRNTLANAGLRVFCTPCEFVIEKATGQSNEATKVASSFVGNVLSACLTAPVHQLYAFCVTEPELPTLSSSEAAERMKNYLKDSYTITENGKTSLKPTIGRDMTLRSMYVATLYTIYSSLERTIIAYWPK